MTPRPDRAFARLERPARLVEELGALEAGLAEVQGAQDALRGDVRALLARRRGEERRAWRAEEEGAAGMGGPLREARCALAAVEESQRVQQGPVREVDAVLDVIGRTLSGGRTETVGDDHESAKPTLKQHVNIVKH